MMSDEDSPISGCSMQKPFGVNQEGLRPDIADINFFERMSVDRRFENGFTILYGTFDLRTTTNRQGG